MVDHVYIKKQQLSFDISWTIYRVVMGRVMAEWIILSDLINVQYMCLIFLCMWLFSYYVAMYMSCQEIESPSKLHQQVQGKSYYENYYDLDTRARA